MRDTPQARHRQLVQNAMKFLQNNPGVITEEAMLGLICGKNVKIRELALIELANQHQESAKENRP